MLVLQLNPMSACCLPGLQSACQLMFCCSQDSGEQLPEERLIFCDSILEIATAAALEECQKAVQASAVCCVALLMKEGQHYLSTLRPLSKSQTTSMHKQAGERLKHHAMSTLR